MPKTLLLNGSPALSLNTQHLKSASLVIKAINHPLRLKLLKTLYQKKTATVTDLYQALDVLQPVVSQNLHMLLKAGYVTVVQVGRCRFYSVNTQRFNDVQRLVKNFFNGRH